jgi:hypothetical protein
MSVPDLRGISKRALDDDPVKRQIEFSDGRRYFQFEQKKSRIRGFLK